jgi:formate dehydrogenase iron-sulfur subunit
LSHAEHAPSHTEVIESVAREFAPVRGGLLPALHELQHRLGHVPEQAVPVLADAFNVSVAEVHGVITFYKDFRTEAPAGPLVQVCRAEACASRGAGAVWDTAVLAGHGKPVEVDEVFCLGLCTQGPAVLADGHLHVGVTPEGVETIIGSVVRRDATAPVVPTGGDGVTVHVPLDAAARAAGADEVAAALAAAPGVRVVRNGSRGALWLEPLVEVQTAQGRIGYANVTAADVPGLLQAGLLDGGDHPKRVGAVDDIEWLSSQQRVTFTRIGVVDPRDPDDYVAHGGLAGLRRALGMAPADVVTEVTDSGLRGRGGAAFPTGIKMRTVLDTASDQKYVVCNADEGDSGTFADRMVMEGDPFLLVEGMTISGYAVGATEGYVYIRSEYPDAIVAMQSAVAAAEARGWLGDNVLGSGFRFRLHVRVGAGAYICGEETALLESLEGRRGVVRAKPPLPAIEGLWGRPTVINNVLSLAALPSVLADGAAAYAALGTGRSRGTQVVQLAGNVLRGGIVEVPFGVTVREVIERWGGGTASGRPVRTVQAGGPLGAYLSPEQLDLPIDYEAFNAAGALLGHGSLVVFDDTVDMAAMARFAMEFCAAESCGKCTPCRIGSTRGVELIDKITAGIDRDRNIDTLVDLCEVMADASLCAMGGFTPYPVRSALTHFAEDFHRAEGAPA